MRSRSTTRVRSVPTRARFVGRAELAVGLAVAVAVVVAVAGCSGTTAPGTANGPAPAPGASTATTAAITTTSTPPATRRPGEDQGAFVFRTQCAGCHGTRGEGNLGPPLVGIADRMTEADQVALVRSGRGRMPPFTPGLRDEDIAAVVAYTRSELR